SSPSMLNTATGTPSTSATLRSPGRSSDKAQIRVHPLIVRGSQRLLEHDELEVLPLGHAESRVAVGEGARRAGAAIAAALVPGDQVLALSDHRHVHAVAAPLVPGEPLALRDQRVPHAAALQLRAHREHAERAGAEVVAVEV